MTIVAGTPVNVSGLTLLPSTDFVLNNISLSKTNSVFNSIGQSTITRAYHFSNSTNPFNGNVKINYKDVELNGNNASNLSVQVQNGKSWQVIPTALNNTFMSFTQSQPFASSMNELTLADLSFAPTLVVIGNPITNNILKFRINTDNSVSLIHFEGQVIWTKNFVAGTYSVPLNNLPAGNYVLRANELTQSIIIL